MTQPHITYITDRMTELSLMMSLGATPDALRKKANITVKALKTSHKKQFSKTERISMLNKFTLLSKAPRPDLIIREILDTWHQTMEEGQAQLNEATSVSDVLGGDTEIFVWPSGEWLYRDDYHEETHSRMGNYFTTHTIKESATEAQITTVIGEILDVNM